MRIRYNTKVFGSFHEDKDMHSSALLPLTHMSPGGLILPVFLTLINAIKNYCSKQDENTPLS